MAERQVSKNDGPGERLPPRLMARLSDAAIRVAYDDGELIHARGDAKPGLSIVHEGAVRFINSGIDGSVVSTGTLRSGEFFGEATLFAGLPRTHDAVADGPTIIDQVSKSRFDKIFDEEPDLARAMLRMTTRRLYWALDFMDDLRSLPLKARVAKVIIRRNESSSGKSMVRANQSDLAYLLGVSRVSIGKALGELQSQGLIKLGYGRIEIPDPSALKAWITKNAPLLAIGAGQMVS